MLSSYPVKLNGTELPFPESWEESWDVVENVVMTEAGTEQVEVARYGKYSVSASFPCGSAVAKTLASFRDEGSLTLRSYDLLEGKYKNRTVRMRNFGASLVQDSKKTRRTNGLWNVSFDLEEF